MRYLAMSILLSVGLMGAFACSSTADEKPATPAPEWDTVFQRTSGWTGGDAIYSVDLTDGRVLWLFADSWVGAVAEGRHAPGSRLVNNALAVHPILENGRPPEPDAVRFFWGPDDDNGFPTAWLRPKDEPNAEHKSWFWVADGLLTTHKDRDRLYVFLWHMGRRADATGGVWNFESRGGQLAVIDNPEEEVDRWKVTLHEIPHAVARAQSETELAETSWGSEVVLNESSEGDSPEVFIFGVREADGWNKQMLLARAPADRIEQFDTWQFRTINGWTSGLEDAASVADSMVSEFSVHRLTIGGHLRWVLVQSEPLFGSHILVRTADQPWGPWSSPQRVYRVPGVAKSRNYFTYAAKAHPELSAPGKLLVSYVINSHDFWEGAADANIYRPRFINLSLDSLNAED